MGSDALVDLDQDTWTVLAKYNLVLATAFAIVALGVRTASPESTLLLVENGVLAAVFGGLQTYCWISA
jgi:hypothetical protein